MINSTFCGSAFSSGITISLSQHTAHTHFSFHRTLCFNDASRLIPEMQFCFHTTDNGLESAERPAWGHPSSSSSTAKSPRGTENHPLSSVQSTMGLEEAIPGLLVVVGCLARCRHVLAFILLCGMELVGCEGCGVAGGWTPPHRWWACLLPPLLPGAVRAPALCQSFTGNYC